MTFLLGHVFPLAISVQLDADRLLLLLTVSTRMSVSVSDALSKQCQNQLLSSNHHWMSWVIHGSFMGNSWVIRLRPAAYPLRWVQDLRRFGITEEEAWHWNGLTYDGQPAQMV